MNVIVSNKQKAIIDNANIDAIKDLNGLFNVNDLVNKFKNYFFSKMILDATSIIDFASEDVLKKLVGEIGADRLVILLPSAPEPPLEFKKLLINLKIYNFSNKVEDIVKFLEKPNTYESVMNSIMNDGDNTNEFYVDSSIKEAENIDDDVDNSVSDNEIKDEFSNNAGSSYASLGDMMNNISVGSGYTTDYSIDNSEVNRVDDSYKNIDINNYQEEINNINVSNDITNLNNYSAPRKSFLNMDSFDTIEETNNKLKKVIGIRNVTLHAGSTTLIYMLQDIAKKSNKDVLSIEINKSDFKLFRCSKMISVSENDLQDAINSNKEELILIDLNDAKDDSFCDEVLYLVEPSIIDLNRLMMMNKQIFNELHDKKVILNKSLLNNDDISILEEEAGMKFFFNINPVNDRIDNEIIQELYNKLLLE